MAQANGSRGAIPQSEALRLYLAMIAGREQQSSYYEIRYRHPAGGMRQEFVPLNRADVVADRLRTLGPRTDTYLGVVPRRERAGTFEALADAWCLWVDIDDVSDGGPSLAGFHPWPSIAVRSGGGLHAYWSLREPLTPAEARDACRRLAHRLGGDMRSTDAARILRPPGTINHKYDPPRSVECVRVDTPAYVAEEVVGGLADPTPPARPDATVTRLRARRASSSAFGDPLAAIPADEYVPLLLGRPLGRDGKTQCPFHAGGQERTPSLHVYPDDRGWTCFGGCPAPAGRDHFGGDIYTFGAALYGLDVRRDFPAIRRRLAADLLGATEDAA
jgi:hypothetical protein